jgi:phage/plasmid primase-like uncharacterized protein
VKHQYIAKVADAAQGKWRDILHRVFGMPLAILDGKWHDCPKCGATLAFRFVCNECGAIECRVCKPLPAHGQCSCGKCNPAAGAAA